MEWIHKPKIKIKKRSYYIFLFLVFIYVLCYTIYLLSALIINTNIYDDIVNKSEKESKIISWMTGKIISYIVNSIFCVVFLIYISLGRHKMGLGYVFISIWILIFIAMAAATHILPGAHDELFRMVFGIISTVAASITCLQLIVEGYNLYVLRKTKYRQMYKIHKQRINRGNQNGK